MIKLGVNIDHVATLRQARGVDYPDPVAAALLAERAGADAITAHLREDRRHIQDGDLTRLRDAIHIHLNQEVAPVAEMVEIALNLRPDEICLVPERREEVTTEGGLDAAGLTDHLAPIVERLKTAQIAVSLFVDPEIRQIEAAARLGADYVELHTGAYANLADADLREAAAGKSELAASGDRGRRGRVRTDAHGHSESRANRRGRASDDTPRDSASVMALLSAQARHELEKIALAATAARELKLKPNVGHGLNYRNVAPVAALAGVQWAHIGHSIVSHAVAVGMERAVREMRSLLAAASRGSRPRGKAHGSGMRIRE